MLTTTVAGAINLHAASNNRAKQRAELQEVQDEYNKKIRGALKAYGNYAAFLSNYIERMQFETLTPKGALQHAQVALQKAQVALQKAQKNAQMFESFVKNKKVVTAMKEFINIMSTVADKEAPSEADESKMKAVQESLFTVIGKNNWEMLSILQDHFIADYVHNTLKLSDKDIQTVQALQEEKEQEVNNFFKQSAQN